VDAGLELGLILRPDLDELEPIRPVIPAKAELRGQATAWMPQRRNGCRMSERNSETGRSALQEQRIIQPLRRIQEELDPGFRRDDEPFLAPTLPGTLRSGCAT
jgi:hypothetical protein